MSDHALMQLFFVILIFIGAGIGLAIISGGKNVFLEPDEFKDE